MLLKFPSVVVLLVVLAVTIADCENLTPRGLPVSLQNLPSFPEIMRSNFLGWILSFLYKIIGALPTGNVTKFILKALMGKIEEYEKD